MVSGLIDWLYQIYLCALGIVILLGIGVIIVKISPKKGDVL